MYAAGDAPPQPPLIAYPNAYSVRKGGTLTVPAPGLLANNVRPPTVLYSQLSTAYRWARP